MHTPSLDRRGFLTVAGLAAVSLPILSACSGDDSSDNGKTADGKVTVEWWNIATTDPGKTLFAEIATAYMAAHPNVVIKATTIENDAFKSKLTAQTASGKLPDVFQTWGGGVLQQQVTAGLVEDISGSFTAASEFSPISLSAYQIEGGLYGVPYDIGMVGFWYNKKLFASAGITAPPATWAEFLEDIKKLKAKGITPIALAGKVKWPGHYYWAYLAMRVAGLDALKQAAVSKDFTGPGFVKAGEHLKELVDLEPFQQGFLGAGYDTPGGEAATVGNSKAAMELMGQWGPSVQAAVGKDLGKDLGFFPFPTVEGGVGTATEVFGGGGGFALRKGAPKEALAFIEYLAKDNAQKLLASNGFLPVVKGTEIHVTEPNRKVVAETLASATGFQLFLDQAYPPAVGQEVNDSVADLIAGKKTPQQVVEAVTKTAKSE